MPVDPPPAGEGERAALVAAAEAHLAEPPFVRSVALVTLPDGRPWAVVWPDEARLRAGGHVNLYPLLRFRIETASAGLPAAIRPRGVTIARAGGPAGPPDRAALATALGPAPPPAWPAHPARTTPLPERWRRALEEAGFGRPGTPLALEASLEFDLGLDSLDRVAFALAAAESCGRTLDEAALGRIWTLGDLIEQLRPAAPAAPLRPRPEPVLRGPPRARFWLRPARATWPLVLLLRAAGGPLLRLLLGGLESAGQERIDWDERPLIVAANHQTHLDAILLARVLPARLHRQLFFLGYTGYFTEGLGGLLARLFRICPISADHHVLSGLRTAVAAVRAGRVLGIFPEAERSWNGAVGPFRRGVAWIARETGARVVPVAVTGGFQAWPRGWGFTPHPFRIDFGPPLDPPAPGGGEEEERRFLAALHGRIAALVRKAGHDPEVGDPLVFEIGPRAAKARRAAERRAGPGVRA